MLKRFGVNQAKPFLILDAAAETTYSIITTDCLSSLDAGQAEVSGNKLFFVSTSLEGTADVPEAAIICDSMASACGYSRTHFGNATKETAKTRSCSCAPLVLNLRKEGRDLATDFASHAGEKQTSTAHIQGFLQRRLNPRDREAGAEISD